MSIQAEGSREAVEVGAAAPPVDVSTTGSASGYVPQPVTTAPIDWSQNPYVQVEGGFIGGLLLGLVPFAGVGHELLDAAGVLPHGTPQARLGLAVGQIVGGIALTLGGLTGEVLGGITSATGIGAMIGMPAIAVSTGLVVGGAANIAAGVQGLSQALMSSGSGSTGSKGMVPAEEGPTTLKPGPFAKESIPAHRGRPTASEQEQVNKLMGKHGCHTCGTKDPGTKSGNSIADHQPPQALGEPRIFLPHCNHCKARQGGEVLRELRRRQ